MSGPAFGFDKAGKEFALGTLYGLSDGQVGVHLCLSLKGLQHDARLEGDQALRSQSGSGASFETMTYMRDSRLNPCLEKACGTNAVKVRKGHLRSAATASQLTLPAQGAKYSLGKSSVIVCADSRSLMCALCRLIAPLSSFLPGSAYFMEPTLTLFLSLFTTLLAIINPLEAIPVYLGLIENKPEAEQRRVARQACFYATLLCFFFLIFGTLLLRIFEVPLSMIRVVGGVILTKVGFDLFAPPASGGTIPHADSANQDVAFVPLAMPIMFGPGAIATLIGMASTIKQSAEEPVYFLAASIAIVACMATIYLTLIYAKPILRKVGSQGLDAATRIVGFFVAAMGMGLIFHGAVEFLAPYQHVASAA